MCQTSFAANSDLFKSCNVALVEKLLAQNELEAASTASYRFIERPNVGDHCELKAELLEPVAKLKETIQIGSIAHFRAASKLETLFGYCHPPLVYEGTSTSSSLVKLGRLASLIGVHSQVVSAELAKYQPMLLRVTQQLATMGMEETQAPCLTSMLDQPFLFDPRWSLKQYLSQIDSDLRLSRLYIMRLDAPCAPVYVSMTEL